jgi:UDPglucose 6-dehydrogenase
MKISVFGSGYVGLVQAAVLAEVGHDVVCMDIDQKKSNCCARSRQHFRAGLAPGARRRRQAPAIHQR